MRTKPYDLLGELVLDAWGASIKRYREAAHLSQSQLAQRLAPKRDGRCHPSAVSHWERGLTEPGMRDKLLLADELGVPLGTLFEWPPEALKAAEPEA